MTLLVWYVSKMHLSVIPAAIPNVLLREPCLTWSFSRYLPGGKYGSPVKQKLKAAVV